MALDDPPTPDLSGPGHTPVLLGEVLDLLAPQPGQRVLDATLGRGGHAAAIIPRLGPGGRYHGVDMDPGNAAYARARLAEPAEAHGVELVVEHANFRDVAAALTAAGAPGVDLLLADLGFASNQMDDPGRGLSFAADAPLDMRLDRSAGPTAAELVNELPERELADLIYELGEERLSRKIARKIAAARQRSPIQRTAELAELVRAAYGPRGRGRIHPATRTFMALRIAVNQELESLEALLGALPRLMTPGGKAAVISFHSLEDRRVKRAFGELERSGWGRRLTRKPVTADPAEAAANPRSRSAKLRAIERAPAGDAGGPANPGAVD